MRARALALFLALASAAALPRGAVGDAAAFFSSDQGYFVDADARSGGRSAYETLGAPGLARVLSAVLAPASSQPAAGTLDLPRWVDAAALAASPPGVVVLHRAQLAPADLARAPVAAELKRLVAAASAAVVAPHALARAPATDDASDAPDAPDASDLDPIARAVASSTRAARVHLVEGCEDHWRRSLLAETREEKTPLRLAAADAPRDLLDARRSSERARGEVDVVLSCDAADAPAASSFAERFASEAFEGEAAGEGGRGRGRGGEDAWVVAVVPSETAAEVAAEASASCAAEAEALATRRRASANGRALLQTAPPPAAGAGERGAGVRLRRDVRGADESHQRAPLLLDARARGVVRVRAHAQPRHPDAVREEQGGDRAEGVVR
jgi:hypothetical protein